MSGCSRKALLRPASKGCEFIYGITNVPGLQTFAEFWNFWNWYFLISESFGYLCNSFDFWVFRIFSDFRSFLIFNYFKIFAVFIPRFAGILLFPEWVRGVDSRRVAPERRCCVGFRRFQTFAVFRNFRSWFFWFPSPLGIFAILSIFEFFWYFWNFGVFWGFYYFEIFRIF